MDQDKFQLTKDIVNELTEKTYSFTAYDVTKLVRGTSEERVPHWQVKKVVHAMFDTGQMPTNYTRELDEIPGTNHQAWIYKDVSDSSVYDSQNIPSLKLDSTDTTVPNNEDQDEEEEEDFIVLGYGDLRNRYCIPKFMTKEMGWKSGDKVFVHPNKQTNKIHIYSIFYSPENLNDVIVHHIDKSGNIRFGQKRVFEAGISSYFFTCPLLVAKISNKSQIVIEKA